MIILNAQISLFYNNNDEQKRINNNVVYNLLER